MSWTKREVVGQAYTELGLPRYVFDAEPEDIQNACNRLDTMIAMWSAKGIKLGYQISDTTTNYDPDQDTNLPQFALPAVYQSLAILVAPTLGKAVSMETKLAVRDSYSAMVRQLSVVPKHIMDSQLPRGAGNRVRGGLNSKFFTNNESASTDKDKTLEL
jgi:hypothetical protein